MLSVYDVSRIIIDALKGSDEPTVTNLALNKMLYFAQGHNLERTWQPLFDDARIKAG